MRWRETLAAIAIALPACEQAGCRRADGDLPPAYRDVTVPTERLVSAEARRHGRVLFLEHCALCHGERADGKGARASLSTPAASFGDPAWRARMTPRRTFMAIREGVRGTPMPAWPTLSDEECWDLVAYALAVQELGP